MLSISNVRSFYSMSVIGQAFEFTFFPEQGNLVELKVYGTSGRIADTLCPGLFQQGAHTLFSCELPDSSVVTRIHPSGSVSEG